MLAYVLLTFCAFTRVVGTSGASGFLWQNGNVTTLPLVGAIAINNKGDILGTVQDVPGAPGRTVLYAHGLITNIALPAGDSALNALAVNDQDQVVGLVNVGGTQQPFFWNGKFWLLNSLIPAGSGWVLQHANGINKQGQIVGLGTLNGLQTGFILTPSWDRCVWIV